MEKYEKNMSSEIYVNAIYIAVESIKEKFYGYGINRYEFAFADHHNPDLVVTDLLVNVLNKEDATNNLAKITTEFGIFSLLLVYLTLRITFSKNIDYTSKLIFIPIVYSQIFIRGAGYFNGGFFIIFLCCYFMLDRKK